MKISIWWVVVIVILTIVLVKSATGYSYTLCRTMGNSTIECQQRAMSNNVKYLVQYVKETLQ